MTSKYGNVRTETDGLTFASKREAARYRELKILESAGLISDIQLQPTFELQPAFMYGGKKEQPIRYKADFAYTDNETGKRVVEDSKGYRNPTYLLKRKLLLYAFPFIDFREV